MPDAEAAQQPLFNADELVSPSVVDEPSDAVQSGIDAASQAAAGTKPLHVRRLTLENFKSFEKLDVTFGPFNILVGTNNSGKSSLLQAVALAHSLLLLHKEHAGPTEVRFASGRLVSPTTLPVGNIRDLWYAGRIRAGNSWIPVRITIYYDGGLAFGVELRNTWNAVQSKLVSPNPATTQRSTFDRIAAHAPVLVPPSVGIVTQEEYRAPGRQVGLVASGRNNEVVRNVLLELKANRSDVYERLGELLKRHFAAHLSDVSFNPSKDQYVQATYSESKYSHELFAAGSGFVQMVQLLTFALRGDPGTLLLDEPDAHLHSSLQRVVIDILEQLAGETGEQILLATHSKEIINYVDAGRIIPIAKGEPKAEALAPYTIPIAVLERLGNVDHVDALWLLRNRRCTLVEGETDKDILKKFAGKAGITVFEGHTQVVVIPIRGVDRQNPLIELDAFEKLLGKPVKALQVRDRDSLPDDRAQDLISSAKRPLHILQRCNIENYLLDAKALGKIIGEARGTPTDKAEIVAGELIDAACEEVREATTDRLTSRLATHDHIVDRKRLDAGTYAKLARDHIAAHWETREERIKIVDGKEAMVRLRVKLQPEGISLSAASVIEAMTTVPDEIKVVLNTIASL